MKNSESEEMYLETILLLKRKNSVVRSVDIAEELGYSRPSVSRAMGILQKKSYITMDAKSEIYLTEQGRIKAESIYERHCVITELLMKVGAERRIAEENACKIEHVLTEEMFRILKEFLNKVNYNPDNQLT